MADSLSFALNSFFFTDSVIIVGGVSNSPIMYLGKWLDADCFRSATTHNSDLNIYYTFVRWMDTLTDDKLQLKISAQILKETVFSCLRRLIVENGQIVAFIATAQIKWTDSNNPTDNLTVTKNGRELTNQNQPTHAGNMTICDDKMSRGRCMMWL